MKKKSGKDRIAKYAFGGEGDSSGVIKAGSRSDDAYMRDQITSSLQFGKGWETTPQGVALSKLDDKNIYNSVKLYNDNPENLTLKPSERVVRYFDSLSTNPSVQTTKTRLKTLATGVEGNLNNSYDLAVQNNGIAKMATGGEVVSAGGGSDGLGGYSGLISQIPGIANSVISLFENNPNAYSRQPIVNANSIKDMVTPYSSGMKHYAMGGEELGLDDDTMSQLQDMADAQGVSIEDLIQQLQGANQQDDGSGDGDGMDDEGEGDDDSYAMGGIRLKKRNMGKYANGGTVEVEGDEVLQAPGGQLAKVSGPSHEKGGVDVPVPDGGLKIYSDRLKIDGKTMGERKMKRERSVARLEKLKLKNPTDKLLQGTLERSYNNYQKEEDSDMQIQKVMNQIYNNSQPKKFAYGGEEEDNPNMETYNPYYNMSDLLNINNPISNVVAPNRANGNMVLNTAAPVNAKQSTPSSPGKMGVGDYVGLAGNAFNAIAPIINTLNNRATTPPAQNRYKSFGKNALDTNQRAEGILGTLGAEDLTDIHTAENTSRQRNRNSASSVNTLRALDATTDMTTNKAVRSARDSMSSHLMTLLGQRSQLQNVQDHTVMAGEERRDIESKADNDNYYSNMAQNLTNFGTNVQGIGRAINTNKSNRIDANLISQLSQYGLGFDAEGNLISQHK